MTPVIFIFNVVILIWSGIIGAIDTKQKQISYKDSESW